VRSSSCGDARSRPAQRAMCSPSSSAMNFDEQTYSTYGRAGSSPASAHHASRGREGGAANHTS
jgi:hypothetical protein